MRQIPDALRVHLCGFFCARVRVPVRVRVRVRVRARARVCVCVRVRVCGLRFVIVEETKPLRSALFDPSVASRRRSHISFVRTYANTVVGLIAQFRLQLEGCLCDVATLHVGLYLSPITFTDSDSQLS